MFYGCQLPTASGQTTPAARKCSAVASRGTGTSVPGSERDFGDNFSPLQSESSAWPSQSANAVLCTSLQSQQRREGRQHDSSSTDSDWTDVGCSTQHHATVDLGLLGPGDKAGRQPPKRAISCCHLQQSAPLHSLGCSGLQQHAHGEQAMCSSTKDAGSCSTLNDCARPTSADAAGVDLQRSGMSVSDWCEALRMQAGPSTRRHDCPRSS